MTAIYYPDCTAVSDDGRLTLEARSPHNGTIRHRDGRKPSGDELEFRHFQKEFRYRLLDRATRRIVWERWQLKGEDSPRELLVAKTGWAVIRTHGFAPELIAVAPDGRVALWVRVTTEDAWTGHTDAPTETPRFDWKPERLSHTTAGTYWSLYSWRYFFDFDGKPHFAWRPWWGQRLVLDLDRAVAFTDEPQVPSALADAVTVVEHRSVQAFLRGFSPRMADIRGVLARPSGGDEPPGPLMGRVAHVSAALNLVGVHRFRSCTAYLREWETIEYPSSSMGSTAMPGRWWLELQGFRPAVHHALKLLGEEPRGYPAYRFRRGESDAPEYYPMPERLTDRRGRAARLAQAMTAEAVLQLLGSPDHVRQRSHRFGELYESPEQWEYDHRYGTTWATLRLTWKEVERTGQLKSIEEVAAGWLDTDERVREFFML